MSSPTLSALRSEPILLTTYDRSSASSQGRRPIRPSIAACLPSSTSSPAVRQPSNWSLSSSRTPSDLPVRVSPGAA
jgi:hypothetical protein